MNKLLKMIAGLLLLAIAEMSTAQTITTFAGNGVIGYSGDGGPSTAAALNNPHGVFMSSTGDKYICDAGAHVIRKVSPSGIISTICGTGISGYTGDGGPATAARINAPFDMVMDGGGNIFFCDESHHVRKINSAGIISTIAGTGSATFGGDGGAATAASFNHPTGIALDPAGNIYVSDQYNHRVRKINTSGIITTIAGTGVVAYSGDGGPATAAKFSFPNFLKFHTDGYLYITDNGNHCIRKYSPTSGIVNTIAGNGIGGYSGDGGPATAAKLWYPGGVDFDVAGNLFITDDINNVVRMVNGAGNISTVAGTGTAGFSGDGGLATAATLNTVVDIMFDLAGNYYIVDEMNRRVRKVGGSVIATDNPPMFTDTSHMLMACENTEMITVPSLEASDADTGQTETYSILMAPLHGTALGLPFSTTSTGGAFSPATIMYAPASMYYGADSFSVMVSDGTLADTQLFHVTVLPNNPGTIAGADTLCIGDTATMSNYIDGGFWGAGALSLSTISTGGLYTALAAGTDTVFYNLPNRCNAGITSHIVTILTAEACASLDVKTQIGLDKISIFPNPNRGVFTIKGLSDRSANSSVIITDLAGRKIAAYPAGTNLQVQINAGLNAGVYLVVIEGGEHGHTVLKMIVTD